MLVQIKTPANVVKTYKAVSDPVVIGSKFKGPNHFIDTANGSSWSVMAPLTANELLIQSALLNKKAPALQVDPRTVLPKQNA